MKVTVLLIDKNSSRISLLNRALLEFGYEVVEKLADTNELLSRIDKIKPDIVVIGIDSPDKITLQNLASLHREKPHPVVVFAEQQTPKIIEQAVKAGVSAFIVDDIQPHRITSIISVAIARFKEQQIIRNELEQTKKKLADRKVVDKAKGILMAEKGYNEDQAYQCLRKMAMNKGLSLALVAENIIDVYSLMKKTF